MAGPLAVLACQMDTNETYRAFCQKLKALGVKQVMLADKIGHAPSWVSDWLNGKYDDIGTKGIDGLDRYFDQLARLLEQRPHIRKAKEPPPLERRPA